MRITDQYFWNIVFTLFFATVLCIGTIILESEAHEKIRTLSLLEYILLMLATFRLTRLFVYDKITAFFREQFYDATPTKQGIALVKPERGPRRTLADLLSCPWCFGIWASTIVIFAYLMTPYAYFPVLVLALGGVGTLIQLTASMIGWKAEQLKRDVEDSR
jgi:hypothetical protein